MGPCGCITCKLQGLTDRVVLYRMGIEVDRLREKLARAGQVVKRATDHIEAKADALIAREDTIVERANQAFAPHERLLDSHNRDLDGLEDQLRQLSNGAPLDDSDDGSPAVEPQRATFLG